MSQKTDLVTMCYMHSILSVFSFRTHGSAALCGNTIHRRNILRVHVCESITPAGIRAVANGKSIERACVFGICPGQHRARAGISGVRRPNFERAGGRRHRRGSVSGSIDKLVFPPICAEAIGCEARSLEKGEIGPS